MKHLALFVSMGVSVLAAACSAAPEYNGGLAQYEQGGASNSALVTAPVGTVTPPATTTTQPTPLPLPVQGPGSAQSSAHQYFIDNVYQPLNQTCGSCHASGANGAPMFLQTNAATAYQTMDGRGMIVTQSSLLTKGQHLGPALTAAEVTVVNQWLSLEAKERVGKAAPVNILERIGDCLSEGLFDAIGFQNLKTTPRNGEDANTCTGCNNTPCSHCHTGGDGNFYMAVGSGIDDSTFQKTKQAQYVVKYIGLNGTQPVPSNAIQAKSQTTQQDGTYFHPMFTLTPQMQSAITAFAQDAIAKYNAGLCGKGP